MTHFVWSGDKFPTLLKEITATCVIHEDERMMIYEWVHVDYVKLWLVAKYDQFEWKDVQNYNIFAKHTQHKQSVPRIFFHFDFHHFDFNNTYDNERDGFPLNAQLILLTYGIFWGVY